MSNDFSGGHLAEFINLWHEMSLFSSPFYGYHKSEHQYLKIYMYNPAFIKRAANLFQNGAILGRINQPHESHVPYILQFLIDYNLYGMSFLHAPKSMVFHRQNAEGEFWAFFVISTFQSTLYFFSVR